ncbi:MAG: dihydroorotate dehydrogenase electron transfer subunit [Proteobacteria bacterium]|nr:dihydroorotate dehydrogenase electron transfer subunit [Pseudomonadota bacterium]
MTASTRSLRGTLFVEDAEVNSIKSYPGKQYRLRLQSPKCAAHATAGSFVHLQCDASIPLRRPMSIMRADADAGWIEILFKVVGQGLKSLANKQPGDRMSSIGPIGHGFKTTPAHRRPLLIGGGVGIPPMIFLAETLNRDRHNWQPLVIMGSEIPFPFECAQTAIACDWLPQGADATMPLLENWGIPVKLASLASLPGTYRGYVTDVAEKYLTSLTKDELAETEIFSCGPTPMLKAVASLANKFELPCQVSLEEYMACGVGGCAGCTVLVQTSEGSAMKRVCIDGPVFQATDVFPDC